jgi:hypothetical protein
MTGRGRRCATRVQTTPGLRGFLSECSLLLPAPSSWSKAWDNNRHPKVKTAAPSFIHNSAEDLRVIAAAHFN